MQLQTLLGASKLSSNKSPLVTSPLVLYLNYHILCSILVSIIHLKKYSKNEFNEVHSRLGNKDSQSTARINILGLVHWECWNLCLSQHKLNVMFIVLWPPQAALAMASPCNSSENSSSLAAFLHLPLELLVRRVRNKREAELILEVANSASTFDSLLKTYETLAAASHSLQVNKLRLSLCWFMDLV